MLVHALRSRAKEKEIIVNPIQFPVHPLDKTCRKKDVLSPFISSAFRLCPCAEHRPSSPEAFFSSHSRTFIQSAPTLALKVTGFIRNPAQACALLDRRSGDEDRFYVFLSDLDWNSVCLRWGDFYNESESLERNTCLWRGKLIVYSDFH